MTIFCRLQTCSAALVTAVCALSALPRASAQAPPTQRELAGRMRQQEKLVRSMECEYQLVVSPTSPEMLARLRARYKGNQDEVQRYLCTEASAKAGSHSARWWRKGEMERLDTTATGG